MRHPIHTEYDVAEDGTVTSHVYSTPRVLSQWLSAAGYPCVGIRHRGKTPVHILVLETYRGLRPSTGWPGVRRLRTCGTSGSTAPTTTSTRRTAPRAWSLDTSTATNSRTAGHAYDEANTRLRTDRPGNRECRPCDADRQRRRYYQQKETAA